MRLEYTHSARAIVGGTLAAHFAPAAPIAPSAWAAEFAVLPDGEYAGEKIDLRRTPHIVEPLDMLGPDAPVNEIAVMKSGQTAFTTMLLCAIGHSIDRDPCDMVVVQPSDTALRKFNSIKLNRMIELTAPLRAKVYPQSSRSATGSTTYEKRFPRGSLSLLLASSPANLRMLTAKKALCDEVDEYEDDLEGQGDPLSLVARGQKSFKASGTWKRAYVSTPVIQDASKIEEKHAAGDQRRWHIECPLCKERIVLEWNAPYDPTTHGLKFKKTFPHQAYYVAQCCGGIIDSAQKVAVYRSGRWQATAPGPGKYPSYHFDELSAPFSTWDGIAADYVAAGNDPAKLKTFWNLTLGLPFNVAVDAPDYELLMQRREDYPPEVIPPGALLVTASADVQMRGIYVEVVAWAPDQQSWTIYADYLDGATTEVDAGAFAELTKLYEREWPDTRGRKFRLDEFLIDSGYRTDVVYEWTRRHPGTKATKGDDGWSKVPLGIAKDQDIDYRGKKIKGGAKLRLMGTWPLKSKLYTYAALMPLLAASRVATPQPNARAAEEERTELVYPPGFCHFGRFLDENYFKQITSEYLEDGVFRGRKRKTWKQRPHRDNHFLDCRVGNIAGAHAYFTSFKADDWEARAKERGAELAGTSGVGGAAASAGEQNTADTGEQKNYFEQLAALNKGVQ